MVKTLSKGYSEWFPGYVLTAGCLLPNGKLFLCGWQGHRGLVGWLLNHYKQADIEQAICISYDDCSEGGYFINWPDFRNKQVTHEQGKKCALVIADATISILSDDEITIVRACHEIVKRRLEIIERELKHVDTEVR